MSEVPEYVLIRKFDAPRDLVWRAWTDPALLHRWYGPNIETIIHEFCRATFTVRMRDNQDENQVCRDWRRA